MTAKICIECRYHKPGFIGIVIFRKSAILECIADFLVGAFMALLLAKSVAKHWGRGCDISIGTIVIISELINCIKRRTAIRKAH